MKIPKYIETALKRRSKAICSFARNDYILTKFIKKNGLEDNLNTNDYNHLSIDAFFYRDEICERIRQAIINKE